jgi:glycerol-3-phosphate dehydrogenase (NAD(P)+)
LQGLTLSQESGINLPDVALEPDIQLALQNADWMVMALPSAAVVELAQKVTPLLEEQTRIASGTKGLHPQSGLRPSQLWEQAGVPLEKFVSFSGPNLATEIVAGVPTSMVVASPDEDATREAQQLLAFPNLRVYRNTDLTGVELGGALKNVVAIAAGICDGLGFGDNAKAALITRGWSEMTRLALKLGARQETLYGLSGMGDLIATCASTKSRNHSIGELLGKGFSLENAQQKVGHVAEGVHTTLAALQLAEEQKVELPITWQLKKVLFEGYNAGEAVAQLMSRPERNELE